MKIPRCLRLLAFTALSSLVLASSLRAAEISLSKLDLTNIRQDVGNAMANKSVDNNTLTIGQVRFSSGVGTHANSRFDITLDGNANLLHTFAGVDAHAGSTGSVVFRIYGDGKLLFDSGTLHGGDAPKEINVPLLGINRLILSAEGGADGTDNDDADWAAATIRYSGAAPQSSAIPVPAKYILTPPPSSKPRINGAKIVGVRPGHPLLYTIAATGDRPMFFLGIDLPPGLTLDTKTGRITGSVCRPGKYKALLSCFNQRGITIRELEIDVGDTIALTPAMGWNSWNAFQSGVTKEKVQSAGDAIVSTGLINHGWSYINIDDYWTVKPGSTDPTLQGPETDASGTILPNPRFADIKSLVEHIHSLGLRAGIYSSPGTLTCGGCAAMFQHERQNGAQLANWGFDYLKYDYCSYRLIEANDSTAERMKPYMLMGQILRELPRDIYFSLCQYGENDVWQWGASVAGNSWRTTFDIQDTWQRMSSLGFGQARLQAYAGPGHWNDPDMLEVGTVATFGGTTAPSRLTPDEQYTHISLWSLLAAPLLIGCDLTMLDDFTLNLLTNDEVIEIDQDPLGKQASLAVRQGSLEVWVKDLADGSKAVGLFNRTMFNTTISVSWDQIGLNGPQHIRDLWRQQDIGASGRGYSTIVPWHGVKLIKVFADKGQKQIGK
jgi:alpha-galactosidase